MQEIVVNLGGSGNIPLLSRQKKDVFLINAHHISPCFMLDQLTSQELWSLVEYNYH